MRQDELALQLTLIVENVDRVRDHVQGYDQQAYQRNLKTKDAVERCLDRIAEAVQRLGTAMEDRHPGLPWNDLRLMATLLRQPDEDAVDTAAWRMAVTDLTPIQEACRAELKRLSATAGE